MARGAHGGPMTGAARRALTLLELLLAISLLGAIAAAGWTWSLAIQRSSAAQRATGLAGQDALACQRLLRDDLLGSVARAPGYALSDEHSLMLVTLHTVPGSTSVGARAVRWTWDAAAGLRRDDGGQVRTLSRRVEVRFRSAGANQALWCDWLAVGAQAVTGTAVARSPTAAAQPLWSLPADSP